MDFTQRKIRQLKKRDKSDENSIDRAILPLIKLLNSKKDYYTTSSCAGRIMLIKESVQNPKQKQAFLFKTHNKTTLEEIKKALKKVKRTGQSVYFKQEPCIMHVACSDINSAQQLVSGARASGWKKSGIMATNKRFMTELVSTELLAAPVAIKGCVAVNDAYLKFLIKEANAKLIKTRTKIKKLHTLIK